METLQIAKSNAIQAFNEANKDGKALLTNLFGKKVFLTNITDRIKTFEDACEEVGENPRDSRFTTGAIWTIAFEKLMVIVRALNQEWTPDWNNSNQYKWSPWFYMNNPGFRFYGTAYGLTLSLSTGGSRLCLETEEKAKYIANQFIDLYRQYLA